MAIAKGTRVRQIVRPFEGTVSQYQVDPDSGEVLLMVEWPTPEGDIQSKYVRESEVEIITE